MLPRDREKCRCGKPTVGRYFKGIYGKTLINTGCCEDCLKDLHKLVDKIFVMDEATFIRKWKPYIGFSERNKKRIEFIKDVRSLLRGAQ